MNWLNPGDPLTLDLDGDGIEAIGISGSNPILFDHNADGIKTATGWIKADDGFVVRDLNGNGTIDSGRELFGDNTLLPNGSKAANGYAAIAVLDSNADGKVDSADAAFSELRIWQDANQDGVSQAGELKTLGELGIASIGVVGSASNVDLGNGNTQPLSATFTRTNGSTGTSGVAELSGSLLLASNGFYREFTDDPAVTIDAAALPQMGGSGWVRDLREAMSLSGTQADALEDTAEAFAAATTRDAQMALVDELLQKWGATSGKQLTSIHKYNMVLQDGRYVTTNLTGEAFGDIVLTVHAPGMDEHVIVPDFGYQWVPTAEGLKFYQRLNVLEAFNGTKFLQMAPLPDNSIPGANQGTGSGGGTEAGAIFATASLSQTQVNLLNQSYEALVESVYSALALQTRLKPYLDAVQLVIDEDGLSFDTAAVGTLFDTKKTGDQRNALIDLLELNRYAQYTLQSVGFDGVTKLRGWIEALPTNSPLRAEVATLGVTFGSPTNGQGLNGTDQNDFFFGDTGNGSYNGGAGDDVLQGGANGDWLLGGEGDDTIDGGGGNDTVSGGMHNAVNGWYSGGGNDTYLFGRGDGQDVMSDFDTTANNFDRIIFKSGVAPADVTVARSNDDLILKIAGTSDQILVSRYFANDGTAGWTVESIQFRDAPSVAWSVDDIKMKVITGGAGADTLVGYASNDTMVGNGGNDYLYGHGGNDVLQGGDGGDILFGEDGNDTLQGGTGNDTLHGGAGDDVLDGGVGDDLLAGGVHDAWNGNYDGSGNDTYLFGRGDGQDRITDADASVGVTDVLIFKAGVAEADVQLVRSSDHLILKIAGTTDQVQIDNYFGADGTNGWQIEEIRFTDAPTAVWTVADVKAKLLMGSSGNDVLVGYASADTIAGSDGDDSISGRDGDDTLSGGTGNDWLAGENGNDQLAGGIGDDLLQGGAGDDVLEGGAGNDTLAGGVYDTWNGNYDGIGNDTYLFGRGDGQDRIVDADGRPGNLDKLIFKTGVAEADVQVLRSGDHLILKIIGTSDQVQIDNYFGSDGTNGWQIEEVRFADAPSVVWHFSDVTSRLLGGTSGNDTIVGTAASETIAGGDGDDSISGRDGDDMIDGGTGADTLMGENGNDRLTGGLGNDLLQGGAGDDLLDGGAGNDILAGGVYDTWNGNFDGIGSDTYLFGRGDGQDRIVDGDSRPGNLDKLIFKTGITESDVQVVRSGDNLILKIAGTSDQVQVDNYFGADGTNGWQIEEIRFTDAASVVWHFSDVTSRLWGGTSGNDTIVGTAASESISGGDGDDSISGRDGDDVLDGGTGNDSLMGENGNDQLLGGIGNDLLQGGAGDDVLEGGVGNDTLAGGVYDTWNGNYDGIGNDTYLFGRGDGQDRIVDADGRAGNTDKIVFKAGVAESDVQLVRNGDYLVIKIIGTSDQIQVENFFGADATNGWQIEEIRFTDAPAVVWSLADMKAKALLGTNTNDVLIGYATADTIAGNDGDDSISGRDGDDTLSGGTGNDWLAGENGNDQLAGGIGDDLLQGGAGDDVLEGGAGNDTLAGGVYDTWNGNYDGIGNDTYLFGRGDGQDRIVDADGRAGNTDKIVFKAGVAESDVKVARDGDHLILKIEGTNDQIRVDNYFGSDATNGWQIEEIRFTDAPSVVWHVADVKVKLNPTGGTGDDVLTGTGAVEILSGGAGNDILTAVGVGDTLDGGSGNDVLQLDSPQAANTTFIGGTGNDTMTGGYHTDTYVFNPGDGQDTISDFSNGWNDPDVLQFGTGILPTNVTPTREGNALVFKLANGTDQVKVLRWFDSDQYQIEQIKFADGTAWSRESVTSRALDVYGTAGDDDMQGVGPFVDVLHGMAGNDTLMAIGVGDTLDGGAGNDILKLDSPQAANTTFIGGTGNDTMTGGYHTDTYVFNAGDGQDVISDFSNGWNDPDVLQFGAGVVPADVTPTREGTALVFKLANGTDQIKILRWFDSDQYQIEQIKFADGTTWSREAVTARALEVYGTAGDDNMQGVGPFVDVLHGMAGNDTLMAIGVGDTLDGGAGNDVLQLDSPQAANTTFIGGTGNDTMTGGYHTDTYVFNPGDGQDTISDFSNGWNDPDVLQFGAGILPTDVTPTRDGNALVFKLANSTDQVKVLQWFDSDQYQIEQVKFADGTTWSREAVTARALEVYGTAGNDSMTGTASRADVLHGLAGDDTLIASGNGDTLDGGDGDDLLKVDDPYNINQTTFIGGKGNDWMAGGCRDDLYVFNAGDGQDTVIDNAAGYGNSDTLQFGVGIAAADVTPVRAGLDLVFKLANGVDQVTVKNWFGSTDFQLEQVKFADGTVWTTSQVSARALEVLGTTGDDTMTGVNAFADVLRGLAGNDTLIASGNGDTLDGGDGDDLLKVDDPYNINQTSFVGGKGNDWMAGGCRSDLYMINAGDGQDTVIDNAAGYGNTDVLKFGAGIATDQLWFRHVGSDLEVSVIGTTDQVLIKNWYGSTDFHIEQIKTSDGKTLLDSDVNALVQAMASFSPPAAGQTMLPSDYQTSLNPVIAANWH